MLPFTSLGFTSRDIIQFVGFASFHQSLHLTRKISHFFFFFCRSIDVSHPGSLQSGPVGFHLVCAWSVIFLTLSNSSYLDIHLTDAPHLLIQPTYGSRSSPLILFNSHLYSSLMSRLHKPFDRFSIIIELLPHNGIDLFGNEIITHWVNLSFQWIYLGALALQVKFTSLSSSNKPYLARSII